MRLETVLNLDAANAPTERDPLVVALARYIEALERRYPNGPDQLRQERLDARAKVSRMRDVRTDPAS